MMRWQALQSKRNDVVVVHAARHSAARRAAAGGAGAAFHPETRHHLVGNQRLHDAHSSCRPFHVLRVVVLPQPFVADRLLRLYQPQHEYMKKQCFS